MKIDIEEKEGLIFVRATVAPLHGKNNNVKVKFLTKDILNYLVEQNIKTGQCIKDASLVTNKRGPELLTGEWIFEKIKPPAKPKQPKPGPQIKKPSPIKEKPPRTRKKSKKVKKTLDKSPEDVIIYIQEETLPSKE